MAESLESVLSEPTAVAATPEPVVKETPQAPAVEVTAPEPEADNRTVPLAALQEERQKRQEIAEQLAEYRGRAEALSQIKQKPEEEADGNDGWLDEFYANPKAAIEKQFQARDTQTRIAVSEQILFATKPDAQEKIDGFTELAKSNPALWAQMTSSPTPAQFAYDAGKLYLETKDVKSVDDLREKIRAEERTKLEAEMRKDKATAAAQALTPTNAGAHGTTNAPIFSGPLSLEQIAPGPGI